MRTWLCLTLLALLPRMAAGQEPASQPLQELFLTEVVYPQEKGEVQLTIGSLVDRSELDLAALVPFSIEYGLTNRWQIEAGWDGYTHFRTAPFHQLRTARVSVGTKYSFMNIGHSPVHAALGLDVEFPNPEGLPENEGEAGTDIEPVIAMAADLGRRVTLFGAAAASLKPHDVAELSHLDARPDDRGTISVGGLLALRHETLAVEYTNRSDELPWRLDGAPLLTPSITVRAAGKWELAAGVPIGMSAQQRQPGIAIHVVKEF